MTPQEALAILAAGLVAGTVNVIVGSGSLVTFPTLLAFGYPALIANISNTVGLVPGSLSGVVAYRRELVGQRRRVLLLGAMSVVGGVAGALLLIELPASAFRSVVPALILLACLLVAVQPRLRVWLADRGTRPQHGGLGLRVGVLATGVYGGYFGAAQGVILISLLGICIDDELQRLNAVKNVLALLANGAAAVVFIVHGHVNWVVAGLIALGSVVGGQLGGTYGRRLPPAVLRVLIVVVGVVAATVLLAT